MMCAECNSTRPPHWIRFQTQKIVLFWCAQHDASSDFLKLLAKLIAVTFDCIVNSFCTRESRLPSMHQSSEEMVRSMFRFTFLAGLSTTTPSISSQERIVIFDRDYSYGLWSALVHVSRLDVLSDQRTPSCSEETATALLEQLQVCLVAKDYKSKCLCFLLCCKKGPRILVAKATSSYNNTQKTQKAFSYAKNLTWLPAKQKVAYLWHVSLHVLQQLIQLQKFEGCPTTYTTLKVWGSQMFIFQLCVRLLPRQGSQQKKLVPVKSHNDNQDLWSRKDLCDRNWTLFARWEPIPTTIRAHMTGFVIVELHEYM